MTREYVCVRVCVSHQAAYRGHVIRVRVRRDMDEVIALAHRRRRNPRGLGVRGAFEDTLRLWTERSEVWVLVLSLAAMPSLALSASSST